MPKLRKRRAKTLAANGKVALAVAAALSLFTFSSIWGADRMTAGHWTALALVCAAAAVALACFYAAGQVETAAHLKAQARAQQRPATVLSSVPLEPTEVLPARIAHAA